MLMVFPSSDGWMTENTDRQTYGQICIYIRSRSVYNFNVCSSSRSFLTGFPERMDGRTDGRTNGWTDVLTDVWTDGRKDPPIEI